MNAQKMATSYDGQKGVNNNKKCPRLKELKEE